MKHISKYALVLPLIFSFSYFSATAQTSINDFAFLTGTWVGAGMGGKSEEMWMPGSDGRMFGIFKQSSEGGLIFSEYMEITKVNNEIVLRLKHFNPDFSGWETKNEHLTFKLSSVGENRADFGSLRYEVIEGDTLVIELDMQTTDGSHTTETFTLKRI
ncbi:MAG: DUF6265 family protein [Pseudohongiellaceae bacterium]